MATPYHLILFDCFNTLYVQDASLVPALEVDGVLKPSTVPVQHARLAERFPGLDPVAMYRAYRDARLWAEERRVDKTREISSRDRFRHAASLLGLPAEQAGLVDELMAAHYDAIIGSFLFPAAHRSLLERLRADYRLALFSNFDHAPPLKERLARDGLLDWLDPVVVSAEIGWRKPGREAFRLALEQVGEVPERILFVGDSFGDDVVGARSAGMDCAWINPSAEAPAQPLTEGSGPESIAPTYELRALTELVDVLERSARGRERTASPRG